MTDVIIHTDDAPAETEEKVENIEDRVERLEMTDTDQAFQDAITRDELATRMRALEVRMELQDNVRDSVTDTTTEEPAAEPTPEAPAEPAVEPATEPEPDPTVDPETGEPEEDVPAEEPPAEVPVPDIPSDPRERPELNPQGVAEEIEGDDRPKGRARKPKEVKPKTPRSWQEVMLGGSGGAKRTRKKTTRTGAK